MTETTPKETSSPSTPSGHHWFRESFRPFQKALVRGLAVVTPPLLTIVLFIWAWNTIESYILEPIENLAATTIVWSIDESQPDSEVNRLVSDGTARIIPATNFDPPTAILKTDKDLVAIKKTWIPKEIYEAVENAPGHSPALTAVDYYRQYVRLTYLKRQYILPAFLALFIAVLYLIGKVFAVGLGRLIWNGAESFINRLPIIRNVYSSVKQVTDFAFNEQEIKFTRIVAVEYPRQGVWSMGFVTGEGMTTIRDAAQEPVVNVLMPTSPMPATGFTIAVPKSQTIDLDITMDQAIQFCVSCGVVVPPGQISKAVKNGQASREIQKITESTQTNGTDL
ncbi:MAG: DUF502 domain-containing protein [Pirellulaceae bacterium]